MQEPSPNELGLDAGRLSRRDPNQMDIEDEIERRRESAN